MDNQQTACFAPLALLVMRETNADGYVLCRFENSGGCPIRLCGCGLAVPPCQQEGLSVARVPLLVQNREVGSLAFVFRAATVPENASRPIEHLARMLESIWSLFAPSDRAVDLVTRISRRQAELADLKIAERALAFLKQPEPGAAETMALHVECVLRTRRFEALLDQFAGDLEDQIEERKVIAQAKDLLQTKQGLTEEEAYAQLRLSSRRSRRRIFEVAHQVIHEHYGTQST
jgi:ANTAR domain